MLKNNHPDPTVLVIFGAGGDLTWRKLIPAVYNLYGDGWIDDRFAVIGVDLKPMDDAGFRESLRQGVAAAAAQARHGRILGQVYAPFALHYGRFFDPGHLRRHRRAVRATRQGMGHFRSSHRLSRDSAGLDRNGH